MLWRPLPQGGALNRVSGINLHRPGKEASKRLTPTTLLQHPTLRPCSTVFLVAANRCGHAQRLPNPPTNPPPNPSFDALVMADQLDPVQGIHQHPASARTSRPGFSRWTNGRKPSTTAAPPNLAPTLCCGFLTQSLGKMQAAVVHKLLAIAYMLVTDFGRCAHHAHQRRLDFVSAPLSNVVDAHGSACYCFASLVQTRLVTTGLHTLFRSRFCRRLLDLFTALSVQPHLLSCKQ